MITKLLFEPSVSMYMPHGHCYLWTPSLVWLHALSDSLIALAYFSIPLTIVYFVSKRRDVPYPTVFIMFGVFIIACGVTHALEVSTIWNTHYYLSGAVKATTAAVSLATAVALVRVVPEALQLAGPEELRRLNESLEARVAGRTRELELANRSLRVEVRERERAENEVKRLNSLLERRLDELQLLFNMIPVGIAIAEDRECRSLRYNDAFATTLGISPPTGVPTAEDPADWPEGYAAWQGRRRLALHEMPLHTCAREGRPVENFEATVVRPDGARFDLLTNAVPVYGASGEPRGCVGVFQDVSSLKKAAASTARLAAIVENSDDAIVGETLDGIVTDWNPGAERLFGYSPDEMIGQSVSRLYPAEIAGESTRALARVATGESVSELETVRRRKNGTTVDVSVILSPIRDPSGHVVGAAKLVRDISGLKRAQTLRHEIEQKIQETQKLESLGVLAGGIAHDFNNLLTGVLGNASLARMELESDSPALHAIDQIESAARQAADLCRQMLAYSGRGRFVISTFDLNELITETTHLLAVSVSKNALLRFDLTPALPPISGDATQLRQVVMNLVINASEATGEQGGVITITTGASHLDASYLRTLRNNAADGSGRYVFLEVRDDGCGMDSETLERLFEPFFSTKFTGRGLGLAAVVGIVRGHKGALKVESAPGKGSTFRLYLPAAPSGATVDRPAGVPAPAVKDSGEVLVVDDEAAVRSVAGRILRNIGYTVHSAENGQEAIEKFRTNPDGYHFVLLDLSMPGIDGAETFHLLREINPRVRVILMSGFDEQEVITQFKRKDLAAFVQKPFDVASLTATVRAALAQE